MASDNKCNLQLFLLFQILFHFKIIFSNSQILNRIIRIAEHPYRYNHFSTNKDGDVVIDTESYPLTKVRKFFGITKNGREYFTDNKGNKTYFSSMSFDYENGRIEGESSFIKIQSTNKSFLGKELILGISNSDNRKYKTELYNLKENYSYSYSTYDIFKELTCDIFSIIPDPLNNDTVFNYYISYNGYETRYNYKLFTIKISFYLNSNTDRGFNINTIAQRSTIDQKIVTCFFTDSLLYACFYTNNDLRLVIWIYNYKTKTNAENIIHSFSSSYAKRFYKGIHLKGDIGFFAYFKDTGNIPTFSLYRLQGVNTIKIYRTYSDMQAKQGTFSNDDKLSDLIKLNNDTACFVSSSQGKTGLYILIFSLFNNDNNMVIRYFFINIWGENSIKFFCDLRLHLYNNFLLMAFSNCEQEVCEESQAENYEHFSSLIFFNYPNANITNFDVINYIYPDNKNIQDGFISNFGENYTIDNNLFGFVYKGIKIISYSNEINLMINGSNIDDIPILDAGEKVLIKFKPNNFYTEGSYNIEFAYIITEPDYGTNNDYIVYIDQTKGKIENEQLYFQKKEYVGKYLDLKLLITKSLTDSCNNNICSLCYDENKDNCVTCRYDFDYNNETNIKTCYNIETETETETETERETETEKKEQINKETTYITDIINIPEEKNTSLSCNIDEILAENCHQKISNDQIKDIYDILLTHISSNASEIIATENVIFQISSLHEQEEGNNPNISSIDLDECEKILKNNSGLTDEEDLIVFKIDIKSEDLSTTYVQYEIYDPRDLNIMSLDVCEGTKITVKVPINLDETSQSLYDSLSKSGYNLFDLNDDFYNDICSTYTTENGTDLTLADRKKIVYDTSGNVTVCQEGCTFQYYNLTTKKSECECEVRTSETITNVDEINFENSLLKRPFYRTLYNSNFRVMKCFKLVFSKKGQKNNFGSYFMTGLCFIFIILLLIYIIKEQSKIKKFIMEILEQKKDFIPKKEENLIKLNNNFKIFNTCKNADNFKPKGEKLNKKPKSKPKNKSSEKRKKVKFKDTNERITRNDFIHKKKRKKGKKKKNIESEISSKSLKIYKPIKTVSGTKTEKNLVNSKSERILTINISKNKNTDNKGKKEKKEDQKTNSENNNEYKKIKNIQDYLRDYKMYDINDEQTNNLIYEFAVIIDKRTFFQYYFSLLKKKQLILFAFYPNNDYNLKVVKISLLILSFSLYYSINCFFFDDESMNKINQDQGKFKLLHQIPKILYSTLITSIINIILKTLSLSEKPILNIKQQKNYIKAKKSSNAIIKCIKVKLGLFFTLSLLFMLFFWYFISCFCAVYENTQEILIIDTSISFILSMIYPFGLNLFPGFFRIPALRDENKYKYIISGYLAFI